MTPSKSNIESEYIDINSKNAWAMIYQQIRNESMKYDYKCLEARKPQNKNLNRYRDVNPFDQSRVVLKRGPCNYINANLVKVQRANRKYILTQGPLPETVNHFWLMIWEQQSKAVMMLNKIVEKKQVKCHWYWPQDIGPDYVMNLTDVGLKLEYTDCEDHSYYITRKFRLTDVESNVSREILQFHYTTWPDFGVPSSPTAFLEFLRDVRNSGALEADVGPAVIHCSAGIGRSGTFCLVDSCLVIIEKDGLNSVDAKQILLEMRHYRMGLIQTPDQLRFSYQAIIEGAKNLSSPNDSKNHNSELIIEPSTPSGDEEDEPPPLPPPRGESLTRSYVNEGPPVDRPLPTIPNSESLNDFDYSDRVNSNTVSDDNKHNDHANRPPDRPLPVVPQSDSNSSSDDEQSLISNQEDTEDKPPSPSELRQRARQERTERISSKLQDIKKRQREAEQWENTKRSLLNPITLSTVCLAIIVGGGAIAYIYFRG